MTKSGKGARCVAITLVVLALLFFVGGVAMLVVAGVWRRAPEFDVVGARLDNLRYKYVQLPDGKGLLLQQMEMSLQVELSNRYTPSGVVFRALELRVAIANQTVAVIRDAGPFHVRARGVLPLGTYVARATNVQLGEPGIRAMDVHHVMPFTLTGQAKTERKVAGFVHDKQTPKLSCNIGFNVPSGEALPFTCSSKTKYPF